MKTIAQKLSQVRAAAPEGWTDHQLRSVIHGVGDSPRRAARLIRTSPDDAVALAAAYDEDIEQGTTHVTAVRNSIARWNELFPPVEAEEEEEAEA